MCFTVNTLNNRIQPRSINHHKIPQVNITNCSEISANIARCYVEICNRSCRQSQLMMSLWVVVHITEDEGSQFWASDNTV